MSLDRAPCPLPSFLVPALLILALALPPALCGCYQDVGLAPARGEATVIEPAGCGGGSCEIQFPDTAAGDDSEGNDDLVVQNTGRARLALLLGQPQGGAGQFSLATSSDKAGTILLDPGERASWGFMFGPSVSGTQTAALEVTAADADPPLFVELSLVGTGVPGNDDDAGDDDDIADDDDTMVGDDDIGDDDLAGDDDIGDDDLAGDDDTAPIDADGDGMDASIDCDDTDATVFPGSVEYCDGVDGNCNGLLDEPWGAWFLDLDQDGYGVGPAQDQCGPVDLFTATVGGDCDDAEPSIHPWATDVDCDGVDNDCVGGDSCVPVSVIVYEQDFEVPGLFVEGPIGSQVFSDGAQWIDMGVGSHVLSSGGCCGSAAALTIYKPGASTAASALGLSLPAPATSAQSLTLSFWALNPQATGSVPLVLTRAGALPVTVNVPAGGWEFLTGTLASTMSTSTIQIQLGLVVPMPSSYAFKLDSIEVTTP